MKINIKYFFLILFIGIVRQNSLAQELPVYNPAQHLQQTRDWLVDKIPDKAEVYKSQDGCNIILDNGLLKRTFYIGANLACVGFYNRTSGEELLRAVEPEAILTLNGKEYAVGGLYGQTEKAYLKREWIEKLTAHPGDFTFQSFKVSSITPYLQWKQSTWAANIRQATGKKLTLVFINNNLPRVTVNINYELYDGIPVVCKSLEVINNGTAILRVGQVTNELLAAHEEESSVAGPTEQFKVPHGIYLESNYAFNDAMTPRFSDQTTHWLRDTSYTSQVSYLLLTPCLLKVYLPIGPGVELVRGQVYHSIRTNELMLDSYDRERNGLAQRMMYHTIAPWATQNPIYLFAKTFDEAKLKKAVDQCAATGFEMLILSFGIGFNMEDTSERNIRYCKMLADYAHSKGIKLGGYSLLASRHISNEDDVIDPKTSKPDLGALYDASPCLGSKWGLAYFKKLQRFYEMTGFDEFDQDGTYPGDVCASVNHPGHKGLEDSQWAQMELQKGWYHWCAARGVFVNSPDWYFLDGISKCALGYREVNFSLPREQQVILNRQNIFDATWEKMPSMGWGFVPLTEYHGGGAAATIEPLSEHLKQYEQLMMQYFGSGVQACYLGTRLYDAPITREMVSRVVSWYKKHRMILNAQIIHLKRPDGQDWDGIMHVDPAGDERALAMIYNPLSRPITRIIKLPLYYAGLKNTARIQQKGGQFKICRLDKDNNAYYKVTIPADGYTWLLIK